MLAVSILKEKEQGGVLKVLLEHKKIKPVGLGTLATGE